MFYLTFPIMLINEFSDYIKALDNLYCHNCYSYNVLTRNWLSKKLPKESITFKGYEGSNSKRLLIL